MDGNGKGISRLINKLTEAMKKSKKLSLLVYGSLIALGLLLFLSSVGRESGTGSLGSGQTKSQETKAGTLAESEMETERRLESILSTIQGAGQVRVMILYETGTQIVPAMNVDSQSSSSKSSSGNAGETVTDSRSESQKPVTSSQSGGETVVLTEMQPKIRGVIISAEGAADISVRISLQRAAETVLGIKAELVEVFVMEKENGGN